MFVSSIQSLEDQLAAINTAMLSPVSSVDFTIKLAKGAFAPAPNSDPTTFTEADFTGYAAKTITAWQTPYIVAGVTAETISTTVAHFSPTGTTVTNVVTGYWVEGSNGHYLGGEAFDTPIPMASPADAINLVPKWQVPASAWSAALIP